jgi:hypothetical protein
MLNIVTNTIFIYLLKQALPSLTIGQMYILGNIKSRYGRQAAKNDVQTALLYNNSEILTFDGKLYQMEGKYYENMSISINFKICYIENHVLNISFRLFWQYE